MQILMQAKTNRRNSANEFENFDGNDLLHELLLTTGQKPKLRNAFNNKSQLI